MDADFYARCAERAFGATINCAILGLQPAQSLPRPPGTVPTPARPRPLGPINEDVRVGERLSPQDAPITPARPRTPGALEDNIRLGT